MGRSKMYRWVGRAERSREWDAVIIRRVTVATTSTGRRSCRACMTVREA